MLFNIFVIRQNFAAENIGKRFSITKKIYNFFYNYIMATINIIIRFRRTCIIVCEISQLIQSF